MSRRLLARRWYTLPALVLVIVGLRPVSASTTADGTYLAPFREDRAAFDSATHQFRSGTYAGKPTDDTGCVDGPTPNSPKGNPLAYRCMPAGASMVRLADGRVLYWDALEGSENLKFGGTDAVVPDGGRLTVNDESRILSLGPAGPRWATPGAADGGAHNTSTAEDLPLPPPLHATHYPYNNGSLFCSDQVILSDGNVLDAGGTDYYSEPSIPGTDKGILELEGIRNTRQFDPRSNRWLESAPMNYGRWYPSLVTMGDGRVFVASGVTKLVKPLYPGHVADSGKNVTQSETYDPVANTWTDNGAAATRSLPLFPRLHLLPDGHVFYDSAGQAFNPAGQSYDEATWATAATYDPTTRSWHDLGIPGLEGPGAPSLFAGFRGSTFDAVLPLVPDPAGHYRSASFLTAGGVLLPSPGSGVAVADSRIDTVTVGGSGAPATSESLATVPTAPLATGRWYGTGVPLPDGTIYAVSGADIDEVVTPGLESPLATAERFIPTVDRTGNYTGGAWTPAGSQARKRTYHNNAVLLSDGSVLIGGHAPIPMLYGQVHDGVDLPGRPGTNNHHDASFQIYRPPYFDHQRPSVGSITQAGRTLVVHTPDAATVAGVVVMRNTAQTHLIDGDARSVSLRIVSRSAGQVVVALPDSTNVLPAGPYELFVQQNTADRTDDSPGHVVPSIGRQLFLVGTAAPSLLSAA